MPLTTIAFVTTATQRDTAQRQRALARNRTYAAVLVAFTLMLSASSTFAFDKLNAAQQLIYDAPHLAGTTTGQAIVYRYDGSGGGAEAHADKVTLSITDQVDDQRRDVSVDFLSDQHRVVMPDFPGYRGNPVIIAMLEHVARSLGQQTGGGALYFRNRIRDALAAPETEVTKDTARLGGDAIDTQVIEFMPFKGDSYLSRWPDIESSTLTLTFSDQVPGGVVAIEAATAVEGTQAFHKSLTLNP